MAKVIENKCGINGTHDDRDIVIQTKEHAESTRDTWRKVWREGLVPQLTTKGLEGLRRALEQDSPLLLRGATTFPPPLQCCSDEPVERCCILCYALLDGRRPEAVSVGPMETRFAETCWNADERTGIPGGIKYFLNFVDMEPWGDVREDLLEEVNRALGQRQAAKGGAA